MDIASTVYHPNLVQFLLDLLTLLVVVTYMYTSSFSIGYFHRYQTNCRVLTVAD